MVTFQMLKELIENKRWSSQSVRDLFNEDIVSKTQREGLLRLLWEYQPPLEIVQELQKKNPEIFKRKDNRERFPIHYLCEYGAPSETIKEVANYCKYALNEEIGSSIKRSFPFDMLFEKEWEDRDQQLKCIEIIQALMKPLNDDTHLLSNPAIALMGPSPYPGFLKDKCFKLAVYMDISSLECVNDKSETIRYYVKTIDERLQNALSSVRNEKGRKVYETVRRVPVGGDAFVIVITGVLTSDEKNEEVPKEIYEALVSDEGLTTIKYERNSEGAFPRTVFTFLRAGFAWSVMTNEYNLDKVTSMIHFAKDAQEEVKKDMGIVDTNGKYRPLEAIGKKNFSELKEYNNNMENDIPSVIWRSIKSKECVCCLVM